MFSFMANTLGHFIRIFRVLHTVQFSRFFVVVSATAHLLYHSSLRLSTTFFNFFEVSQLHFSLNAEGGIWTLAPLLTTYSLSRGAPSTTWVLLHLVESHSFRNPYSILYREPILLSSVYTVNGESGIRTHAPFRTNGFQDRLVMTTSIPLHILFCVALLTSARVILTKKTSSVNNFF